jgi:hypothetical protein
MIFFGILAILGIIAGIVMATISYADYQSQGVVINHTEQAMFDTYYNNSWTYTGLAGSMITVPKIKLLVEFSSSPQFI